MISMKTMIALGAALTVATLNAASPLAALDPASRNNVTLTVSSVSGGYSDSKDDFSKTFEAKISAAGKPLAGAVIEFYVVIKTVGYLPFAKLIDSVVMDGSSSSAKLVCDQEKLGARFKGREIKGWFARVILGDRVAGIATSNLQYEVVASDPLALSKFVKLPQRE